MSFHWQFGVVESGASASVSAPSAMYITDSGGSNTGNNYIDIGYSSRGRAGTFNVAHGGNVSNTPSGTALTIKAWAGHSGTAPTSYAWGSGSGNSGGWSVSYNDVSGTGVISGSVTTGTPTGSTYDDFVITLLGATSDTATLTLTLTGTNSGGSTDSSQFSFTFTMA